jgi:hypothetical protein
MLMTRRRAKSLATNALMILLAALLATQPIRVSAAPKVDLSDELLETLAESGEDYVTSLAEAMFGSLQLVPAAQLILDTPPADLDPLSIKVTRSRLLRVAQAGSIALGAAGRFADAIERVGPNLPAAIDISSVTAVPPEMSADLVEFAGFSAEQAAEFQTELQALLADKQALATAGFPGETTAFLEQVGFTQADIDRLEVLAAERGIAQVGLTTRLDQFRAAQDDLAEARTSTLVVYSQMVVREVMARQATGVATRPVTDAELTALAEDELRLLIHVAHLQEFWGEDPSLEVGEGDWWFIERYAGRAAARAEEIILESQNSGLTVDLFLAEELRQLATTARSGDAAYARAELDGLADLIAFLAGDEEFLAAERSRTSGLGRVLARLSSVPAIRARVTWPIDERSREAAAQSLRGRLSAPLPVGGVIPELNEANNSLGILVATSLEEFGALHPTLLSGILNSISEFVSTNVLSWLWAVLSGQTDNFLLLALNMGLSIIPVIGVIPDLISLFVDPSVFVKVLSVFGIIGSLGDILALFGVTLPIAVGSFVGDAVAAVLKGLFRAADDLVQVALNGLRFPEAFRVVKDLIGMVAPRLIDASGGFGHNLTEAKAFFSAILEGAQKFWDDFMGFVRRVGTSGLRQGLQAGDLLIGRFVKRGFAVSDELAPIIRRLGNDLFEAGIRLGDEAADGLGTIVQRVGGENAERFVAALRSNADIGDDLVEDTLAAIGRAGRNINWTDDALDGVENIVARASQAGADGPVKIETLLRAVNDPEVANKALIVLREINTNWSDEAMEGVARLLRQTPGQSVERVTRVLDGTSRKTVGEAIFRRIKLADDAGIDGWPLFAEQMTRTTNHARGAFHTLDFMEEIGYGNITRLEEQVEGIIDGELVQRAYDVVVDAQRFELKNVAAFTAESTDELRRDLLLLDDDQLRNLTWVFRGPHNQAIVDDFIQAIQRYAPRIYREGVFTEANLVFFRNTRPF